MVGLDLTKRDMMVVYGERTFALRAYRQSGEWRGVIIENRTPLRSWIEPTSDPAMFFAAAVTFIAAMVDASIGIMEAKA